MTDNKIQIGSIVKELVFIQNESDNLRLKLIKLLDKIEFSNMKKDLIKAINTWDDDKLQEHITHMETKLDEAYKLAFNGCSIGFDNGEKQ